MGISQRPTSDGAGRRSPEVQRRKRRKKSRAAKPKRSSDVGQRSMIRTHGEEGMQSRQRSTAEPFGPGDAVRDAARKAGVFGQSMRWFGT